MGSHCCLTRIYEANLCDGVIQDLHTGIATMKKDACGTFSECRISNCEASNNHITGGNIPRCVVTVSPGYCERDARGADSA